MLSWLINRRYIYILSNLIVLPAKIVPCFELLTNLSFIVSILLLVKTNLLLLLAVTIVIIIKNNSDYRFNLLLKIKGQDVSKSDYECVYLYAWCTLLRYFVIGIAANEIVKFLK